VCQQISLGLALTHDSDTMLRSDFKAKSTLQHWPVMWGLHPLIYLKLTISLVDVGLLTQIK